MTILVILLLGAGIYAYKKYDPYANNKIIAVVSLAILIVYFIINSVYTGIQNKHIANEKNYKNNISQVQSFLGSADYAAAYNKIESFKINDEDKRLKQQVLFLYEVSTAYDDFCNCKPENQSDVNKNKNTINSLIKFNNYLKSNKAKAIKLGVKDKFHEFEKSAKSDAEILDIKDLNSKLDVNKIATNLANEYKKQVAIEQKEKAEEKAEAEKQQRAEKAQAERERQAAAAQQAKEEAEAQRQAQAEADQKAKEQYAQDHPITFKNVIITGEDNEFGSMTSVKGEATNNTDTKKDVTLTVSFYDSSDNLLGTASGYVLGVNSGETKTFEAASTDGNYSNCSKYNVQTDTIGESSY